LLHKVYACTCGACTGYAGTGGVIDANFNPSRLGVEPRSDRAHLTRLGVGAELEPDGRYYTLNSSSSDNSSEGPTFRGNQLKGKIDAFQMRCRKTGLKVTPQRVAVYKALIESKEHPSADMLWRKVRKTFPNISLDTVNRTLLTLAEIGAAFVVEGSGDVKRFDGCLKNHQHFKCIKCKKIIDFRHKPFDNITVPKSISEKYTVLKKTVYLEGICDLCKKRICPSFLLSQESRGERRERKQ
jgi:Fur family peroxide stress response transcriptional regulator